MTKRFWIFVTFAGGLLAIAGLILTIVLTIETGQEVDDSECDSMAPVATAEVLQATCVTSDDPKVLLGIIPLLAGLGISGVGIWRWIAAANETSGSSSDGDGGGGLMGSLKNLQTQAQALQDQAMQSTGTMSAGTPPPSPPPGTTPPSPPAPPAPDAT